MEIVDLKSRGDLGSLLNSMGLIGDGAEIGVAYGENAKLILDTWAGRKMLLIDPYVKWEGDQYVDDTNRINFDGALEYAIKLLSDHSERIEWLRMTSDDAVSEVPDGSLDFIYIDGNHHNPQLQRDLDNWFPKVVDGGVFCGHDFYDCNTGTFICEVRSTVTKFCNDRGLRIHNTNDTCSSWFTIKQ